jgi:acetyl coenzyme A synthetase (ADP forming)-like protein
MGAARSEGLDELFEPRSIAVIGASNRPGTVGMSLFRNILQAGFRGVAYPVNPTSSSVSGVHCYPDIAHLPDAPDLGIVIVPARSVSGVVEELGRAGTRGVIVVSSGFREVGGDGIALEEELVRVARRYRMSLVGPNCFGLLNTDPTVSLNATFSESLPPRGNIAFVSQSGALCAGILQYGIAERIGFSQFVSVGNRAGIDENDLLQSIGRDPATRVILLYVESLADGRRFLEAAREVTGTKPVLVIKSGRTAAGERAARSHTGSLAQSGRDQLYDALFEQSGVQRVDSIGELFRTAKVFAAGLRLDGPRLAILTNSGGPGIVAADAAVRHGLELPLPTESERAKLARILSPSASLANPLDMTADAKPPQFSQALRVLLDAPGTDGVMVISTPTGTLTGDAVASAILEAHARSPKAVAACLFGLTDLSEAVGRLESGGVPSFTFPEEAIQGLGSLARYRRWLNRPRTEVRTFPVDLRVARAVIARARRSGVSVLPEYAARTLLEAFGIPFTASRRIRTADEAVAAAEEVGFPVVLKVASPDISHKTEAGGVMLHLEDGGAVRDAVRRMGETVRARAPQARIEGFEVEAEVRGGKEVLIGLQRDPGFGPVIAFGLGGIYVEVLRDVTFRLAPVRSLSARLMVESVKAFPLLQGVRGEPASDIDALTEAIERISQLAIALPDVAELDINPLIVRGVGSGVVAVDARVVLASPSTPVRSASVPRSRTASPRTPRRGGRTPPRR